MQRGGGHELAAGRGGEAASRLTGTGTSACLQASPALLPPPPSDPCMPLPACRSLLEPIRTSNDPPLPSH